jgi:hypothetical protein
LTKIYRILDGDTTAMSFYSYLNRRGLAGMFTTLLMLALTLGVQSQAHAQQLADQEVPDNYAVQQAPEQPVPYSHKTHLALGLTCETCHTNPESDVLMGFPETDTCMACHNTTATEHPGVKQLTEFSNTDQSIPWERVYQVLPGVTWAHQPHAEAGVQCESCHGDVSQLEVMSMTTSVTSMASCISCHENRGAETACATCHAWPSALISPVDP